MIPFDGKFAQNTSLPLSIAAYDSQNPPAGYVPNQTAFEILADMQNNDFQLQSAQSNASHQRMMQSMLRQPSISPRPTGLRFALCPQARRTRTSAGYASTCKPSRLQSAAPS